MELNEAARRIFRGHWLVIITCVALGLALGYLVQGNEARFCTRSEPRFNLPVTFGTKTCTTYSATVRLQLDVEEPKGVPEAIAAADTTQALASSPSHVAAALAKAGVKRDPSLLARYGVRLGALGTSGIQQLLVTDTDPKVAAAVANALADDVVATRRGLRQAEVEKRVAAVDAAIGDLNNRIGELDAQLDELSRTLAPPPGPGTPTARADSAVILEQRRGDLAAQRLALQTHRLELVGRDVTRPQAAVVEPARPPVKPDPSRRAPDMGLGLLLGLVLGVGLAALLETIRPTLIGRQAVARAAGAPALGELRASPERLKASDLAWLAMRLRLAATAARVLTVELVPAGSSVDVSPLADRLQRHLSAGQVHEASADAATGSEPPSRLPVIRPLGASSPIVQGESSGIGLVLVAPRKLQKADLDPVTDLLAITGWPILGVITYRTATFWRAGALNGNATIPQARWDTLPAAGASQNPTSGSRTET